ncbi:Actin-related protein 2/3 complex subunit 5 [Neolecta irregularis DAH-3]|uniref:Actin-related protein 2/3 complex subunit 5 n=1 Tax=Neolecta irregularis (strain DAH-3) TaxID=1198029 RepID=A0A1U7LR03_NEOID|nr:Actin-related protein 2/3 complex subunit 5 [Neolecta irregularis DAH-3]|eukprot:OLL25058.1 Actin-related protein 2/3 complex subunit 5 [Neolecta irregularis DAH-3]
MSDGSFRKIDIDAFGDDHVTEEELYPPDLPSSDDVYADVQGRTEQVRSLLRRGDVHSALPLVLANPPYGVRNESAKEIHSHTVMEVLSSIKASEITILLKQLSPDDNDVLMKYLYKGMASPETYNMAVLLNWHEKLVEVAGNGAIVRAISGYTV